MKKLLVSTRKSKVDFNEFLKHLLQFKEEFGNANIPEYYICKDGYDLGSKSRNIRRGQTCLTEARVKILNALGFVWDNHEEAFNEFLRHYLEFSFKQGFLDAENQDITNSRSAKHILITDICDDGYPIGRKINMVRSAYVAKQLSQERIDILNSVGFTWNAKSFDFETFMAHLKAYIAEHNTAKVPRSYVADDGYKLGRKVALIRHGNINTSEQQKDILNSLGFIWSVRKNTNTEQDTIYLS